MAALIMDFGENAEGLNIYRITGTKDEIEKAIKDLKDLGFELWHEPYELEKAYKSWSVLVKFLLPKELKEARQKDIIAHKIKIGELIKKKRKRMKKYNL